MRPYNPGDVIQVHKSPEAKLPKDKAHLYGKEGIIKLPLGGEHFKWFVVEIEGELHQLYHANLIPRKLGVKITYRVTLWTDDIEKKPLKYSDLSLLSRKPVWFDQHPTSEQIGELLYQYKATHARVERFWEAKK